jgi:hypothetical protein
MISRRFLVGSAVSVLATASLAGGVGLAVGSDSAPALAPIHVDRQVTNQEVHQANAAVLSAFSTFAHPSGDSAATPAEQATLRNALGSDAGTEYGAIGHADFSMARAAPIQGSSQRAWLVPSGDEVCVVLPDPEDGFAATCHTLTQIKAGEGVLALTPQRGSATKTSLVAVIVPDGGDAPALEHPDGSKRLSSSGNVAAASASTSDRIATSARTFSLAAG